MSYIVPSRETSVRIEWNRVWLFFGLLGLAIFRSFFLKTGRPLKTVLKVNLDGGSGSY